MTCMSNSMHTSLLGYLKAFERYISITELMIFPQKWYSLNCLHLRKWHLHFLSLNYKHLESTLIPLYLSPYVQHVSSLVNAAPKINSYPNTSGHLTAPSVVPTDITSHLNYCRVLKKGSFSSFSFKHNNQSDFLEKQVSSCNYCAQNQNIILHFSQSKDLSKTFMTQTPWPHWLSGLSSTPVFFPH